MHRNSAYRTKLLFDSYTPQNARYTCESKIINFNKYIYNRLRYDSYAGHFVRYTDQYGLIPVHVYKMSGMFQLLRIPDVWCTGSQCTLPLIGPGNSTLKYTYFAFNAFSLVNNKLCSVDGLLKYSRANASTSTTASLK